MPGGAVLPDLSALPLWAQILIYSIFGISVSIVVILTMLGYKGGMKSSPSTNGGSAKVAAVIVDPTALNAAAAAVKELSEDVRDLNRTISSLTLEMARGNGGGNQYRR